MKQLLYPLLFLLTATVAFSQQTLTLDPGKDAIARRLGDGTIFLTVPTKLLNVSIQEALPDVLGIEINGIKKIGKSAYLLAKGLDRATLNNTVQLAILMAETATGEFYADGLVISCSSTGSCRECSLPPSCSCTNGDGSCSQGKTMFRSLAKVTVTINE
jgi:hypothetical protein